MQVAIVAEKCQGHGRCQTICPSVFDLDDDGFVALLSSEVPSGREAEARSAAASCPEGAIVVS